MVEQWSDEVAEYYIRIKKKFRMSAELMQLSFFAITIPPRTPEDLHRKFAPTLGLLHPNFCPGGDLLGHEGASICLSTIFAIFRIVIVIARIGDRQYFGV